MKTPYLKCHDTIIKPFHLIQGSDYNTTRRMFCPSCCVQDDLSIYHDADKEKTNKPDVFSRSHIGALPAMGRNESTGSLDTDHESYELFSGK